MDLALNNLQRLICHKTQQTKPKNPPYLLNDLFIYKRPLPNSKYPPIY